MRCHRIFLLLLTASMLGVGADKKKCGCERYPFEPDPPCSKECSINVLLVADLPTLVSTFGLLRSTAAKVVSEQRSIRTAACKPSGMAFGVGEIDYDKAEEMFDRLLRPGTLSNFYKGRRAPRDLGIFLDNSGIPPAKIDATELNRELQKLHIADNVCRYRQE